MESLSIAKGEIVGLAGENGAGKSTLIKLILNIIYQDQGTIKIYGMENDNPLTREFFGAVFDCCSFSDVLCITEINRILRMIYRKTWQEKVFEDRITRYNLPRNKPISQFSQGMKAKLSLIATLSHFPRILFLDEATNNLDPVVRKEINELICEHAKKNECTVVLSSHLVNEMEQICDRVFLMAKGKIKLTVRKNELDKRYYVIHCHDNTPPPVGAIAALKEENGISYLVCHQKSIMDNIEKPVTLESIMYYMERGEILCDWPYAT